MWQAGFSGANSPAPQTPAYDKSAAASSGGDKLHHLLSHDAELLAAQTRLFQVRSCFPAEPLPELAILHDLLAENEKVFLASLQALYSATLSRLLQPQPDSGALTAARQARARLVVQTQKAHLRRASAGEIEELHAKLRSAEENIRILEQNSVEELLENRLNEDLDALEKRARGELRVVEMLRRRRRTESWRAEAKAGFGYRYENEPVMEQQQSEPQSRFSPITPYTATAYDSEGEDEDEDEAAEMQPAAQTKVEAEAKVQVEVNLEDLPPLPASTVEEELLLASAPFTPFPKPSARPASAKTPRLSLSTTSKKPPPRPLFSPSLPPEFMALPAIVTQSPTPTSGSKYRRATFSSSPLSACVYPDNDAFPPASETVGKQRKPQEDTDEVEIGLGSPVLCTRVNGVPITMI